RAALLILPNSRHDPPNPLPLRVSLLSVTDPPPRGGFISLINVTFENCNFEVQIAGAPEAFLPTDTKETNLTKKLRIPPTFLNATGVRIGRRPRNAQLGQNVAVFAQPSHVGRLPAVQPASMGAKQATALPLSGADLALLEAHMAMLPTLSSAWPSPRIPSCGFGRPALWPKPLLPGLILKCNSHRYLSVFVAP